MLLRIEKVGITGVFKLLLGPCMVLLAITPWVFAAGGTWESRAPMPTARSQLAVAAVGDKIYAFGGFIYDDAVGTIPFRGVEIYDSILDQWTADNAMQSIQSRAAIAVGVIDGLVYVVGGGMDLLEIYDPATDAWSRGAPMPTARAQLAAGVIDGKLYVVGGEVGGLELGTLEVYDPATNQWSTKSPMPTARRGLAAAVLDGKLYAIGGQTLEGLVYDLIEIYDPVTDQWTEGPAMPTERLWLGATELNGYLYTIGGAGGPDSTSVVEAYYPEFNTWATLAPIPTPRHYATAVTVGENIYVVGGETSDQQELAAVEVFNPPAPPRPATAPPPPPRPRVCDAYDSFDGDAVDANRWRIYGPEEIFSQSNGQLHADGPPNQQQATLKSRQTFSGDFDFILEYNNFITTATSGIDYSPQLSLNVSCGPQGEEFVFIFKNIVGDSWNKVISNAYINGQWRQGAGGEGTGNSGYLRITRTGTTIKTYYYEDGSTDWVLAGHFTNSFAEPVNLEIQVVTSYDGTFHVSCDGVYQESEECLISNPGVQLLLLDGK